MIGFLLVFAIVLGAISFAAFGLARMRRARRTRRREARLQTAFERARCARMHGFNPIGAGRPPLATQALWRASPR